jgi:hypothetical protein
MPAPPASTDEQIDAIMRAAAPLAPDDRTLFLEAVVAALDGKALGDWVIFRTIREVQARYLEPRNGACGRVGRLDASFGKTSSLFGDHQFASRAGQHHFTLCRRQLGNDLVNFLNHVRPLQLHPAAAL